MSDVKGVVHSYKPTDSRNMTFQVPLSSLAYFHPFFFFVKVHTHPVLVHSNPPYQPCFQEEKISNPVKPL